MADDWVTILGTTFNPEGSGYDYETAAQYGLSPDETGHWPSRVPETGQILKGQKHSTYNKTVAGEKEAGFIIEKGLDGKYYSSSDTDWEPITDTAVEDEWEPVADIEQAPLLTRVGGAFAKGGMRLGEALIDLPKHIVGQVKKLPMELAAHEILIAKDPKDRVVKLENYAKVENFFNKVIFELSRAGEAHRRGQETILKNHPEWESEPPESFIDLVSSPDKLVVALAESTPLLLGAGILTAAGQPQIGVMMMYASEGQEAYDRAKADGASDDVAETAYNVYGIVAAALEQMQLQGIMKISKGLFNRVLNRTAQKVSRMGAKALTMEVIKIAAKEGLEEVAQGEWGDITAKMIHGEPFGPLGAHIDRRAQEFYIGAAMGLIPGAGGATVGKVKQQSMVNRFTGKNSPLKNQQFAVLTAENPGNQPLNAEENTARNVKLIADLKALGKIAIPVEGRYGGPVENSFLVFGLTNEQALELGKKYGQESVLTPKGLIYQDGTVNPADLKNINFKADQADFYSIVDVGGRPVKFSIPINFETKEPLAPTKEVAQPVIEPVAEVVTDEIKPVTADEAIGKQFGLTPEETDERLGKAELRYRELKNKPVAERTYTEKKELAFLSRNRTNIEAILDRETRPAEKKMSRKEALALGHSIPEQLGWTEEQRRAFNKKITNQRSMKGMTPAQRQQIITALTKEAEKAGIEITTPDISPIAELMLKLQERKQKPALTQRDRRNMKKLRKIYYQMKSGTSFYFLHMSRIKRLSAALDNYETNGPFTRYIYQPVKDADTQAAVNFSAVMEASKKTFEDLGIDIPGMFSEIKDIGIEDKLSTSERIGVWALAQNEKTKNHLRSEFTDKEIDKIVESVEDNEKEMLVAAEVQTYFETGWDELKAIAEAHGIKGIVKEENYITAFIKNKEDVTDTEFMEGLVQQFTQGKFVPGEQHTIKRKPGAKRNLELNVFMIHARAAKAMERFKVMAPIADKTGQMLKHSGFKDAINATTYGHGSRLFDKWLQDSIRGQSSYDNSAIGQALRWLRMRSVHYVLGAKILTAAKQGISLFPAMGIHPGMAPLILANISHNPFGAKYKAMEAEVQSKSAMMRHRDWDRDLRQTYDKKAVQKMYAGKKLSPVLMRMATWVDRHTASAVWYSAYQLSQKQGMDEKDSIKFADGVVEKTQPMGKAVDLPAFFRGSELEKNFSIFQNQVNQNGNMLWYDILGETKARKISLPMLGYRLMMQQVAPALLLGMVSRGHLPEDFKEIAKDLAFYLLSPYFVIGRFLYNTFIERDWGPTTGFIWETPLTETFRAVGAVTKDKPASYASWGAARQKEWDQKRLKDIAKYGARAVGAWTGGYPPLQVIQTIEGGWNLAIGETDDFRELIWSEYALKKGKTTDGKPEAYYKYQ
ncbi:hypothetical protein LCGC14_0360000 [marine sediment metagenome]|uniref:Large polyvalent protein associated domain-containing protein n=1 Tax=marine sediment metagenome TaxID=412755 RepID=A0A0F9VVI6_9ZZZZ